MDGALGILFAHLLMKTTSRSVIIKASILLYIALVYLPWNCCTLSLTPILEGQTFSGRFSNLFSALLWGIILGWVSEKV